MKIWEQNLKGMETDALNKNRKINKIQNHYQPYKNFDFGTLAPPA